MASYLQEVKDELSGLVSELGKQIEEGLGEEVDGMSKLLDDWKKDLWRAVEKRLKQSYENGRRTARGVSDKPPEPRRTLRRRSSERGDRNGEDYR